MPADNPDGGGMRIEHVLARAKERCGLVLTANDIEGMEHRFVCLACGKPDSWRQLRTRPHGHQDWEITWKGATLRVVYDPEKRHIRTIMEPRGTDGTGFNLGATARVQGLPKR